MDNFLPSEVVPCSPTNRDAIYELDPNGEAYENVYALRKVTHARREIRGTRDIREQSTCYRASVSFVRGNVEVALAWLLATISRPLERSAYLVGSWYCLSLMSNFSAYHVCLSNPRGQRREAGRWRGGMLLSALFG